MLQLKLKVKLEELEGMQSDMTTYMQIRSINPDAVNRTHLQRMDRHSKGVCSSSKIFLITGQG